MKSMGMGGGAGGMPGGYLTGFEMMGADRQIWVL